MALYGTLKTKDGTPVYLNTAVTVDGVEYTLKDVVTSGSGGTVDEATTDTLGTVKLASDTDITAGTAGKVVDAAQLKKLQDAITALEEKVSTLSTPVFTVEDGNLVVSYGED